MPQSSFKRVGLDPGDRVETVTSYRRPPPMFNPRVGQPPPPPPLTRPGSPLSWSPAQALPARPGKRHASPS